MICINKKSKFRLLGALCLAAVFLTACGNSNTELEDAYAPYSNEYAQSGSDITQTDYFASDLCVTEDVNFGTDQTTSSVAEGAGVFNLATNEVTYSQNLFEQLYPASTTKILTAYIIIKNCNLDDQVTIDDSAVDQASDSSTCGLKAGDITTVRNLLYGLMLPSGNDAAIALAEYYSGSAEAFAEVMNEEAKALGATNSNFVNPNGLPDENHYTTVYDMYLIFKEAIQYQDFLDIISTSSITVTYYDITGNTVEYTYHNTNKYVNGNESLPDGFTVVGGKTGTTNAAGYCLVLLTYNAQNQPIISIVYKADGRSNLYYLMNQILSGFGC